MQRLAMQCLGCMYAYTCERQWVHAMRARMCAFTRHAMHAYIVCVHVWVGAHTGVCNTCVYVRYAGLGEMAFIRAVHGLRACVRTICVVRRVVSRGEV